MFRNDKKPKNLTSIKVSLTEEERAAVRQMAEESEMTMSALVRDLLQKEYDKRYPEQNT